jgi:hypothetical protein
MVTGLDMVALLFHLPVYLLVCTIMKKVTRNDLLPIIIKHTLVAKLYCYLLISWHVRTRLNDAH